MEKVHTGINLLFADVPKNLQVPHVSTSSEDIPLWNRCSASYFGALFAFVKKNLHDDSVIVFTHAADLEVHAEIHNWAHMKSWYMAEEWFGMNNLDLRSPTNPIGEVCYFSSKVHFCQVLPSFFKFCEFLDSNTYHVFFRLARFLSRSWFGTPRSLKYKTKLFKSLTITSRGMGG